jgi:hypothetical protein
VGTINIQNDKIEISVVKYIWFIPLFLEWQTDRVAEKTANLASYKELKSWVIEKIGELLGNP